MAFQLSGTNWRGQKWKASASISALASQVTAIPNRPSTIDGTVASRTHDAASPTSDHSPQPKTGTGIVRALDATFGVTAGSVFAEALRASRDPRIKYVIFRRRFFSSYATSTRKAWEWAPYTGPNPHDTHVHVSVLPSGDKDSRPFDLTPSPLPDPGDDDMPLTPEDLNKIADAVWYRKVTHPVTGEQRGAQALLADTVRYSHQAASKSITLTPEQVALIADAVDVGGLTVSLTGTAKPA